jgi:Asp-tRNA(Asn)/Glu-tRNA(Gln) amidotransferase A subunit family amidase
MARSVEDCALILDAIQGADAGDPAAVNQPFSWPSRKSLKEIRVGFFPETSDEVKQVLTDLGVKLVPMKLPSEWPLSAMVNVILDAECASAFDDLTRSGVRDGLGAWPSTFLSYRFISAIDYLRANRLRTQLMAAMAEAMKAVDVYVGGNDLVLTNLTGHPTICMPNGFTTFAGAKVPTAITFTGQLYGETALLTVAKAYQDATGHHRVRPTIAAPNE